MDVSQGTPRAMRARTGKEGFFPGGHSGHCSHAFALILNFWAQNHERTNFCGFKPPSPWYWLQKPNTASKMQWPLKLSAHGGWKSEIRVPVWPGSGESPLSGGRLLTSPCVLTVSPPHSGGERQLWSLHPLRRAPIPP